MSGINYEQRALEFCERYGIVEYRVKGKYLIFNKSYPKYLNNPRYTMQHKVNLETGTEEVKQLGRFDPKGLYNR